MLYSEKKQIAGTQNIFGTIGRYLFKDTCPSCFKIFSITIQYSVQNSITCS